MSIAPSGRDVVLAGRKGLFVIDLDDPFAAPRWLHHQTSWEVADVQWSPHKSKPSWVVSTSNQKAMVWNLARPSHNAIEHVLHSHTRAITDINFHPNHPELLATCSVDTMVLSWDMRSPQKPINSWSDWRAAASQVKWNHMNSNVLASTHDNNILIWDIRKGAIPLVKIQAHNARINGIDWSKTEVDKIISCSNDMSVKFWDQNKPDKAVYTIRTDFPVSRARHAPIGDHICGIMPSRGGQNSIYIVKFKDETGESKLKPSYIFKGHTEPVKDFLWRSRHSPNTDVDDREFQLVTWSADCDLRLWPIQEDIYDNFNYKRNQPLANPLPDYSYETYRREPPVASENNLIIRRRRNTNLISSRNSFTLQNDQFNHLNWISGIRIGQSAIQQMDVHVGDSTQPANLAEEVGNVGHKFPKVRFERISVSTGNLVISLNGPWNDELIFIRVEISFSKDYPSPTGVPKFSIEETHELTDEDRKEMLARLDEIASKYCSLRKFCLEPCLRFLLGEKVNLDIEQEEDDLTLDPFSIPYEDANASDNSIEVSSISDRDTGSESEDETAAIVDVNKPTFDSTPVPKGCGAIWTASGHLVCFFIPKEDKKAPQQVFKFGQQGFSLANGLKSKKIEHGMELPTSANADSEDDVSSLSSEASFSNDLDILQYDRLYKTKLPLENVASNPGTHTSKSKQSRNIVKIHDFRHLIPAKMELAFEYRVLGDTPENLAKCNALVAEKYGFKNLADCWRILSIILVKEVQFEDKLDLAVHAGFVSKDEPTDSYKFYWGAHPFGGRWLAKMIMKYYERRSDVQMLAMLSCVLYEHFENKDRPGVPINTPYSLNSVIPEKTLVRQSSKQGQVVSFDTRSPVGSYYHLLSRNRLSSVSTTSISESLVGSPGELHVSNRRGIRPQSIALGHSTPGDSYSLHLGRSPGAMSPSSLSSTGNVFSQAFLKSLNNTAPPPPASQTTVPKVSIQMINTDSLDLYEDAYSMSLLDDLDTERLQMYRAEYANLLFCWGLPVSRAKILKFNHRGSEMPSSSEHRGEVGWLKPVGKSVWDSVRTQRKCHYCHLLSRKRLVVCTVCNHLLHAACALLWWEQEKMEECCSGCGCRCLKHRLREVEA
ncbi:hypothetical protein KL911_004829 [Ogataea haglerorum]|uniref:uncharacterized protein n=1 Tax=Ogataea haglerorum TaxID=1937702 RepID=UPI001C8A179B|nr:uncharacterized protein KL911_004829 [Ogataea haglerorum]KAG7736448.1 hypothetical protein KL923_004655 [Ogataea haglerorum]KAG7746424.1 hypothetical protein KL912_004355 [Ogataea haglerorum]KAG7750097.1 hypothetical protein KL911_004829 [Ogataea haglerorum]